MMSKTIQNLLTTLIVVVLILVVTLLTYRFLVKSPGKTDKNNPYEYDIEAFKNVPPELLHYQETDGITCQGPHAIAIDSANNIYIADNKFVIIYSPDLAEIKRFSVPETPKCITVDNDGTIYIGKNYLVWAFDKSGNSLYSIELESEYSIITSIAVTKQFIFIADASSQAILKYDHNGQFLLKIGVKDDERDIPGFLIPSPYFDIAIDQDGFIWAANPGRKQLENYTKDGALRSFWGVSGMEINEFSGCCNPAHFTLTPDGSFVTVEKGLARVKVYNRIGHIVSVVAGPKQFHNKGPAMDVAVDSKERVYVVDPVAAKIRIFKRS